MVEDLTVFFSDFAAAATLAGVAVVGILDTQAFEDGQGVVTQAPSFLLQPTVAVTPAPAQALVAGGVTYTVRQVLRVPPDGALQRLVLARV